jgi:hypothetical protein
MFLKSWLSTLVNRFRFNCSRRRHGLPPFLRQTKRQVHVFSQHNVGSFSERLEDRTLLEASVRIISAAAGAGTLDADLAADGQVLFSADDGGGGDATISSGQLLALASSTSVRIEATSTITFEAALATLALPTSAGRSVTFSTDTAGGGNIEFEDSNDTLTTEGAQIVFNAGAGLDIGSVNAKGASTTIVAGLQSAGNLVVENISNATNLTVTANNAAGGTIKINGIASATAGVAITARGNIELDALSGGTTSITTATGSIMTIDGSDDGTEVGPIQATGSQLTLNAATGINVTTLALQLSARNSTSGDIFILQDGGAPQALSIEQTAGAGVRNDASGGTVSIINSDSSIATVGTVVATGAGPVIIQADTSTVTIGNAVTSGGGTVAIRGADGITISGAGSVNTGGGTFTANADFDLDGTGDYSQAAGRVVQTGGALAQITASDVEISGSIDSGTGRTRIRNSVAGRQIDLGSANAGRLSLVNSEINLITAGVIEIGRNDSGFGSGDVFVTAAIAPTGTTTLSIVTSGLATGTGTIAETNLRISAENGVSLDTANDVDTLAIETDQVAGGAAGNVIFRDADGFTVGNAAAGVAGDVDGVRGIDTGAGGGTVTLPACEFLSGLQVSLHLIEAIFSVSPCDGLDRGV